ncbi:mCG147086 [Mus musculus]|nr:mCG147086 [Mus musculus]
MIFDFFFFFLVFRDRVSLCSPGCPGTHSVDQAGLELRNPPASASRVLGLKAQLGLCFYKWFLQYRPGWCSTL